MPVTPAEAAQEMLDRRGARTTMREFVTYTWPGYRWNWHHEYICEKLDELEAGHIQRLIISVPAQHGKTELASRRFPSFFFGKHPEESILHASYAAGLVSQMNRDVQGIIDSPNYNNLFPGTRLYSSKQHKTDSRGNRNTEQFNIVGQRGFYRCAGVGGQLTGFRCDLGIIDDPFKDYEEAVKSKVNRETVWNWYLSVFMRRLRNSSKQLVIMCMTGDTLVLMEGGCEKPLRDIKPGDRIATYDNGKVSTTSVINWANQGLDTVYEIRMKSGIIVKANARHPFLVKTTKGEEWRRTALIRKGDIIHRVIGVNGEGLPALKTAVKTQPNAKGFVTHTTTREGGRQGCGRLPSILSRVARHVSSIATKFPQRNTTGCLPSKEGSVLSASDRQVSVRRSIGETVSAWITATKRALFGVCFATTAILQSAMEKLRPSCLSPLSTCEVTGDEVLEVVLVGVENVYDIQVERTANFIANGLVSHNTRWHEEDLVGMLLQLQPERWENITLEGLRTKRVSLYDPRREGEALWPQEFSKELLQEQKDLAPNMFEAMTQQNPVPPEGSMFKRQWFDAEVTAVPADAERALWFDKASTDGGGDYTAGVLMAKKDHKFYIESIWRFQKDTYERDEEIKNIVGQVADKYGKRGFTVLTPQDPGAAGKDSVHSFKTMFSGYRVASRLETGAKEVRADPFAGQCGAGNVHLCRGIWQHDWIEVFLHEICAFPDSLHDDQTDAAANSFNFLNEAKPWISDRNALQSIKRKAEAALSQSSETEDEKKHIQARLDRDKLNDEALAKQRAEKQEEEPQFLTLD